MSDLGLVTKNLPATAGECRGGGFSLWVGKIPWGRKWQPTPVSLPGKRHRQRSLAGYSLWGRKELTQQLSARTHTHTHTHTHTEDLSLEGSLSALRDCSEEVRKEFLHQTQKQKKKQAVKHQKMNAD